PREPLRWPLPACSNRPAARGLFAARDRPRPRRSRRSKATATRRRARPGRTRKVDPQWSCDGPRASVVARAETISAAAVRMNHAPAMCFQLTTQFHDVKLERVGARLVALFP